MENIQEKEELLRNIPKCPSLNHNPIMVEGSVCPTGYVVRRRFASWWVLLCKIDCPLERDQTKSHSKTPMSERPREQLALSRIGLPCPGLADLWRVPEGECFMAGHSSMAKVGNAGGLIPGY